MTHQEIIIAVMVAAQMFTLFLLWDATKRGDQLQAKLKSRTIFRDPKTGRFIKNGKI